jgi:hypothetical protein
MGHMREGFDPERQFASHQRSSWGPAQSGRSKKRNVSAVATPTLYLSKLSCLEYVDRQPPPAQGCHPTKLHRQGQSSP